MRKKFLALAVGMTVSLAVLEGCSGQVSPDGSPSANPQTEASTETNTENTEDETQKSGEESNGEQTEEETNALEEWNAIRIWGTISGISERMITVESDMDTAYIGEIELMIDPDNTYILDGVNGYPVNLEDVEMGRFEAYLGPAMTMSLPPQNTPYLVIVNIPEGVQAPLYVTASDQIQESDGKKILAGTEKEYTLAEEVEILPFLTRNIVTLEEIEKGSRCLVWLDEEEMIKKIVLFP